MIKTIIPQGSFARVAEGKVDFDGDKHTGYLIRKYKGGNKYRKHYNLKQHRKDAAAVNRGDFIIYGGNSKGSIKEPENRHLTAEPRDNTVIIIPDIIDSPPQQTKNLDLIKIDEHPVSNNVVKDTTGANAVGFAQQPPMQQAKRVVGYEQGLGAAIRRAIKIVGAESFLSKVTVNPAQKAAAANIADGPVAAAVAAKTATEAVAKANDAQVTPSNESGADIVNRALENLANNTDDINKISKARKLQEKIRDSRNKRYEANIKWFSDRLPNQRGNNLPGPLNAFKNWDPFTQPLNRKFRIMENRLQQAVPPYDLPKNYPIYGGALDGYPRVNSIPYSAYARNGRTGRRTNYEKYGVPSVRMYQQMLKSGVAPGNVPRGPGRPRTVQQQPPPPPPPPPEMYDEPEYDPTPQYTPQYYNDGPTYAQDYSYRPTNYGEQVQKIAKNLMWGPPKRYTTSNQIVGSILPNTTSNLPTAYYLGSKAFDYITPQAMSKKDELDSLLANVKITQMIDDTKDEKQKNRLREMAKNFGNLNDSGWKKALRWGATGASLGLKGLGLLSENFWPMHDAYHRYKTMSGVGRRLGTLGTTLLGMMPRGYGYRRRKKRSNNKKCKKRECMLLGKDHPTKTLKEDV